MKVAKSTVEDVRFTFTTMACSVLGMALWITPTSKRNKEWLRPSKVREEEQENFETDFRGTEITNGARPGQYHRA
jgi:hypothetical protein